MCDKQHPLRQEINANEATNSFVYISFLEANSVAGQSERCVNWTLSMPIKYDSKLRFKLDLETHVGTFDPFKHS